MIVMNSFRGASECITRLRTTSLPQVALCKALWFLCHDSVLNRGADPRFDQLMQFLNHLGSRNGTTVPTGTVVSQDATTIAGT